MNSSVPKSLQVSCVQLPWAKPLNDNLEKTLFYIQAASQQGSRVVLFPEANLTGYYFPFLTRLSPAEVQKALEHCRKAASNHGIWVIVGSIQKRKTAI